MHQFKDNKGRAWNIDVNVASIKRLRQLSKAAGDEINLLAVVEDKGALMKRLATDPILLVDVIYLLVQEQCQAQQVSDEDFGAGLAGDAIALATDALLEDLADFFPKGKRELIGVALAKMKRFQTLAEDNVRAKLEGGAADALFEKALTEGLAALNA